MQITDAVQQLDERLRAEGRPGRAEHDAAYLRSELTHYGTSVPAVRAAVRALVRALRAGPSGSALTHDRLIDLATRLWDEPAGHPVHERRLAAAMLLTEEPALIGLGDVPLIERMIRQSRTWALVDVLAEDLLGRAFERIPDQDGVTRILDRWAGDADFWVRRSALLVHQRPLRAGAGDWERFARYADAMLDDREFFIRKAIGWVLREASKRRPELVFDWLMHRADRVSGVTLREAVKYLSEGQRHAIRSSGS